MGGMPSYYECSVKQFNFCLQGNFPLCAILYQWFYIIFNCGIISIYHLQAKRSMEIWPKSNSAPSTRQNSSTHGSTSYSTRLRLVEYEVLPFVDEFCLVDVASFDFGHIALEHPIYHSGHLISHSAAPHAIWGDPCGIWNVLVVYESYCHGSTKVTENFEIKT